MSLGYESLLDFSRKSSIHRSTIQQYLDGKDVYASAFNNICSALNADPVELMMPISETTISIPQIDEVLHIIAKLAKADKKLAVILIGSRAKGKAKSFADWDLAITCGENPLAGKEYLKLRGIVEEMAEDLPRGIDLINMDNAPEWFFKEMDYTPLFLDGSRESFTFIMGVLNGIKRSLCK
ncbi:MAG: nucleotidyltransferase domain-containing protein [Pseudomonadota bacterium]